MNANEYMTFQRAKEMLRKKCIVLNGDIKILEYLKIHYINFYLKELEKNRKWS